MFAAFGYAAILSPNYEPIREQLRRPDHSVVDGFYAERDAPEHDRSIYVLRAPSELNGCYVIQIGRRAIFMPYPFQECDPYPYLRGLRDADEPPELDTSISNRIAWPRSPEMQFDDGRFTWDITATHRA